MTTSPQDSPLFQQFDEVMQKIDFSSGRKIHSWRIFLVPYVDIRMFFHNNATAELHYQILRQSEHVQMLFYGNIRLFVYHLTPENQVEIDETPLDMMKFAGSNEKIVKGYKKSGNLLFYAQGKDIEGLFEVRSLLDELTDPARKSDYDPFVPEAPFMRTLVNHLPIKSIRYGIESWDLNADHLSPGLKRLPGDQMKFVDLFFELTNPDLAVKILLYPSEEEVKLLNIIYSQAPADEKSKLERHSAEHGVQFRVLPKRIVMARPGNKNPEKTSDPQSVTNLLDRTIELITPIDPDLSKIVPWSGGSSSDKFYYWEDILDYLRIY